MDILVLNKWNFYKIKPLVLANHFANKIIINLDMVTTTMKNKTNKIGIGDLVADESYQYLYQNTEV